MRSPIDSSRRHGKRLLVGLGLLCPFSHLVAEVGAEPAPVDPPVMADPVDLLSDDLLQFEDLPVVVSASRQESQQHLAMTPVSVIDRQDLDQAAYLNIYEALTFVPGVDVLSYDRNRYGMGVRGLHDTYSDRTLTLIDGRPADSPVFGGSEFFNLPILLGDIERIEVVRGPGGAVWGANAFTGVVNIITRRPDDPTLHGLFASGLVTHFGDASAQLRHAGTEGSVSWRASVSASEHQSSRHALDDDAINAQDYRRTFVADADLIWAINDRTSLRLGAGFNHNEAGSYIAFGVEPEDYEGDNDSFRSFISLTHQLGEGSELRVDFSNNYQDFLQPSLTRYWAWEHDFSTWATFPVGDHSLTLGGNARSVRTNDADETPTLFFVDEGEDETNLGAFIIDRWQARDDLVIEGQIRIDDYSATDTDWSGRLGLVYTLDEEERHFVRLAGARAFRTPYSGWRRLQFSALPLEPFGVDLIVGDFTEEDLKNEETWALESGYTGFLAEPVVLRVDGYFQRFEDLIGIRTESDPVTVPIPLPPFSTELPRRRVVIENGMGADSYGVEIEMTWKADRFEVGGWYAYNGFDPDDEDQSFRGAEPAPNKVGGRLRYHFTSALSNETLYRWTDETKGDTSTPDTEDHHRLDIYLRYQVDNGRGNILAGVRDVFDDTDYATGGVGDVSLHEVPGRTFVARVDWTF